MTKLKGPLMSLDARGKIGGIVYQKTKKTNWVKSNKWSKKKGTSKQNERRIKYGKGIEAWRAMTPESKQIWKDYAKGKKGSGFNYFMQFVLTSITVGTYGVNYYNACAYG